MKIAFVQLARYGDIVNALPIAWRWHKEGHEIHWVVHEKFADILEAASYVTPHLYRGLGTSDVPQATELARRLDCDRVVVAQVDGNETGRQAPNYTVQNWLNAGVAQFYHAPDTQLVFDRRDKMGELEYLASIVPEGDKPILCYHLGGHSSPFPDAAKFERWLLNRYSSEYRLVPLHVKKADKAHHLLGPIGAAELLITTDSLPMHLSFATGTPTIGLSRSLPWAQSERRRHWLGRLTYEEVLSDEGLSRIEAMIEDRVEIPDHTRDIVHVVDWYEPADRPTRKRYNRARRTWEDMKRHDGCWRTELHRLYDNSRSSKQLGDSRKLPFLKDVIELAMNRARVNDYIVLTNADSCLPPECPSVVRSILGKHPCAFSMRIDIRNWVPYSQMDFVGLPTSAGADLFCFRPGWWERNRDRMPDLLLACEGWDFVLRKLMEMTGGVRIDPPVVYHEIHEAFWSESGNIVDNVGQQYNRKLCREWALANGFGKHVQEGSRCLFV